MVRSFLKWLISCRENVTNENEFLTNENFTNHKIYDNEDPIHAKGTTFSIFDADCFGAK